MFAGMLLLQLSYFLFDRDRRGTFPGQTSRSDRASILDSAPLDNPSQEFASETDEMDIPGFVQG